MRKSLLNFLKLFHKRTGSEIRKNEPEYITAIEYISINGSRGLRKKPRVDVIEKTGELNPAVFMLPGEEAVFKVRGLRAALNLRSKIMAIASRTPGNEFSVNFLETGRISKVKVVRKS